MLKTISILFILALPSLATARWIEDIVPMEQASVGTVEFSHYQHLEAVGNDCVLCHNRVFHIDTSKNPEISMLEMEQGKSCGSCHNGIRAFSVKEDCATCHPTRDISFKVDAGDALFSHDIHSALYSCNDCHPDLFLPDGQQKNRIDMEQMASGESCGACHDGDSAFSVEENCENCHDM